VSSAVACAALAALLLLAGAGSASAEPVTLRDALGRAVTLPAPPQRIVTIFASNTEMVAALGLAERIVGIEAFTRYPPQVQGKPLVGGRLGFSVDAVVRQRPDLVVVTPARQAAHQLVDPMERIGVPVIVLQHATVAEVLANIRLLGLATGADRRADELAARLEARIGEVQHRVARQDRPRTVMITGRVGNGLLLVARPGTYTGDAIALSGARFALADRGIVAQVSPEAILDSDPDTLLFAGSPRDLEELVARPGWRDMRAVRAGRVHAVSRAEFLIPGPRTVDGIERLARLLHAQAFQP
jgi:iron complex transport system substrate-binding protein